MSIRASHSQKAFDRENERQQRRERAHNEAQALRDPTPEHHTEEALRDHDSKIKSGNRVLTLGLFAVIVLCLLLSLMLGVGVYRNMVNHSSEQQQIRLETALIANNVRQIDNASALGTADGPEGKALVFTETYDDQSFETRYYLYEGWLMQEYTLDIAPIMPETADQVAQTSVFDFTIDGNLISITTDAGTSFITMRSDQGGE